MGSWKFQDKELAKVYMRPFNQKCECCNGNGLKKTKSIVIHNLISLIKNLNSLDGNETYEIRIDDQFFKDNENEINKRIKSLKLSFGS